MSRYSETTGWQRLATSNTAATSFLWRGGRGVVGGTASAWGTATLEAQLPDGSTWVSVDATDCVLSADGMFGFEIPPCYIRIALSGTTAANVWVGGTGVS